MSSDKRVIKIGGVSYPITVKKDEREIGHDINLRSLWGEISYTDCSINILDTNNDLKLRNVLHEVVHGIVFSYKVRELIDKNGMHYEDAVDGIAYGIAEVLDSLDLGDLFLKRCGAFLEE